MKNTRKRRKRKMKWFHPTKRRGRCCDDKRKTYFFFIKNLIAPIKNRRTEVVGSERQLRDRERSWGHPRGKLLSLTLSRITLRQGRFFSWDNPLYLLVPRMEFISFRVFSLEQLDLALPIPLNEICFPPHVVAVDLQADLTGKPFSHR